MREAFFNMSIFKKKNGVTLVEILVSMLLMIVVFMAVSALYIASHRFYLSESDKVMIGYELKYAMEHIYKNAMQGIGDKNNPPIIITPGLDERQVVIAQIEDNDPATPPSYSDFTDDKQVVYAITNDGKLSYVKRDLSSGAIEEQDLDMIPAVTLVYSNDPVSGEPLSRFYLDNETLCVKLTAQFPLIRGGAEQEQKTLYGACSPRLASYN